jgi:type I restriction enzyme S subunit
VIPPIGEQEAIDAKVSHLKAQFSGMVTEANKAVHLLTERRSALISAAVTGKIDVRNWQSPADEGAFDEKVRQAGMEAEA